MSRCRIYEPFPLAINKTIRLSEGPSHHLSRVLRVKKGEKITLFNGEGGEYLATITHFDKKEVIVDVLSYSAREAESSLKIHLVQGIARGEKMDFIIQKAVELGVKNITPLITERCNVRMNAQHETKRLKHWQAVAVSACEQSGRNRIPSILPPILLPDTPLQWEEWIKNLGIDNRFVLTPTLASRVSEGSWIPAKSMRERQEDGPNEKATLLLTGPEGGLSERETSALLAHGFNPLNLGPRVLRTETASVAGIAILQYCCGDMS